MLACPTCGDTGSIEVAATVWVHLIQHTPVAEVETEPSRTNGGHEWDDDSNAVCTNCRWSGRVVELAEPQWTPTNLEIRIQDIELGDLLETDNGALRVTGWFIDGNGRFAISCEGESRYRFYRRMDRVLVSRLARNG